jgi:hypothetical protein
MEISDALKKRVSRISAAEVDAAFLAVTQPSVESNRMCDIRRLSCSFLMS